MHIIDITEENGSVRHVNLDQVVEVRYIKEVLDETKGSCKIQAINQAYENIQKQIPKSRFPMPISRLGQEERIIMRELLEKEPTYDKTILCFSNGTEIKLLGHKTFNDFSYEEFCGTKN